MNEPTLPLGIRTHVLKDGSTRYEARINLRASKPLSKRFETVKEAISWRITTEALIGNGVDPHTVMPRKASVVAAGNRPVPNGASADSVATGELTIKVAIERYLKYRAESHNKIPANRISDYERVANDWGNFLVSDIRNEDVANYISLLLKTPIKRDEKRLASGALKGKPATYAKATVRKFIYAMKIALEWQAKNSRVQLNPHVFDFDNKVMPAAWDGHRERRLNPEEEEKLYAAGIERGDITYTEADWRALIGFTLETAMRQQELAKAEWKHIFADGRKLRIPADHTKTKTNRTVLLSQKAREIIKLQRQSCPADNPRIFYQFTSAGSICDSFAKLRARAGIEGLTFHDLRHEATSRLCESGKLSLMELMEMTGHKSLTTFGNYVHLLGHENKRQLD